MTLLSWGIVFALILVNAFFVAAEFAAVSVPRVRVAQRAEDGDVSAARLEPHLSSQRRLDRYVSASQIGITISSLILGAWGRGHLGEDIDGRRRTRLLLVIKPASHLDRQRSVRRIGAEHHADEIGPARPAGRLSP